MIASISLVGLAKITMSIFQSSTLATWESGVLTLLVFSIVGSWYFIWKKGYFFKNSLEDDYWIVIKPSIFSILSYIFKTRRKIYLDWKGSTLLFFISLFFWLPIVYFTTLAMLDLSFSWWAITGSWLTFVLVITLLFLVGKRKAREAENPLHGILEPPSTTD
jgi:hypothetical protein